MYFAQAFWMDRAAVNNAQEVGITRVDLYFKTKPKIRGNRSGIAAPGVEIFIAPTYNGVPLVDNTGILTGTIPIISRREYAEIIVSNDAQAPTRFVFDRPIQVRTGNFYAVLIKYDGDEDFLLWDNVFGEFLIDSNIY